jgi:hypothetical protein
MKHQALDELYKIMQLKDWTDFCPEKNREESLQQWIAKWLIEVEQSQLVVDSKYLNSEASDFVKYRMGQVLGEALTEECVTFKVDNRKISGKLVGLRRSK